MKTMKSIPGKQKGFTLVELIVVLVIGAVVIMFATQQINRARSSSAETQLINEVSVLRVGANNWKGTRPNYSGVACDDLVTDEYVEVPWTNCTGVNPQGGNYTVAANSSNSSDLTITATGLGETFCNRVARSLEPNTISASCSGGTLTASFRG